ncbi:MAG: hypothetical protein EON87_23090 [Brevundimonas sp.]|nr:MAG: hypothetical protein EON87_23090 [Brevundimonas sp.]
MLLRVLSRIGLFAAVLIAGGCAARYSFNAVEVAKTALLGMDQKDIRMCAGFPNRSFTEDGVTIWSYDGPSRSGGINVSAPVLFGAANTNVSLPGGGNCRVQMRFIDGRLDRLAYSGDNDGPRGRNTVCTPVVEGCLDYAQNYRKGRLYGRPSTATAPMTPLPTAPDQIKTGSIPTTATGRPEAATAATAVKEPAPVDPAVARALRDEQDVRGN